MNRVKKLEIEVKQLSRDELSGFRDWFREFDSDDWDKQINKDIKAGRLELLAEEAVSAHNDKRSKLF